MPRPDPDRHERARPASQDQIVQKDAADQEQEQGQEERKDSELERAHNRLGNAALSALLGASNAAGAGDTGGGRVDMALAAARAADQARDLQHGGEGDPAGDAPITLEDLTRAWNPRLKKEKERPEFKEGMPDDALPPEDAAWLEEVRAAPTPDDAPTARTPDTSLQPSAAAIAAGLGPWVREAAHWAGHAPSTRALFRALSPPVPSLQDPSGRVLLARARAGAMTTWALLDTAWADTQRDVVQLARVCLELAASRCVERATQWAVDHGGDLPLARAVLQSQLPDPAAPGGTHDAAPHGKLGPAASSRVFQVLLGLVDLPSGVTLLPSLPDAVDDPEDEDDDPLGLEAILRQHTGAAPDPEASAYQTCLLAAEKLAAGTARARVRLAGAMSAVATVAVTLGQAPPSAPLIDLARRCDDDAQRNLQMLVDIARATQRRTVPLRGVQNGLKRAARAMDDIVRGALEQLVGHVAGLVPATTEAPDLPRRPPDALDLWLRDGPALDALPWLAQLRSPVERESTTALVFAVAGIPPHHLLERLRSGVGAAAEARRGGLMLAMETMAGGCLVWTGATEMASALARRHMDIAIQRRNGVGLACAALLGMEALSAQGQPVMAAQLRLFAGRHALAWGAEGALSLLARWTAPEEDQAAR